MFKKIKRRPIRQTQPDAQEHSDEDNDDTRVTLQEMRQLQSTRKRPRGVNVEHLSTKESGKTNKQNSARESGYSASTGGMVDMTAVKSSQHQPVDDAYDTGIGTAFSAETNKRDEDAEMQKYIDEEMSKRRGMKSDIDSGDTYTSPEQAALMAVPEHLREATSTNKKSEDMLSSQMLCGIPEVDLGIESKIRNIETTEEAKMKILADQLNGDNGQSCEFAPSNMAVNFRHHNRFNLRTNRRPGAETSRDDPHSSRGRGRGRGGRGGRGEDKDNGEGPVLVVGGVRAEQRSKVDAKVKQHNQPSDDMYYNRFRNQFWR